MDLNTGSWWWTGRPGMLQPMGLQRVGHNWATELNILVKAKWFLGTSLGVQWLRLRTSTAVSISASVSSFSSWMKILYCLISKQKMLLPSVTAAALSCREPRGDSGWKLMAHCQALSHGSHPHPCTQMGAPGFHQYHQDTPRWERTGHQPSTAKVLIKGVISMSPDSCIFRCIEKS